MQGRWQETPEEQVLVAMSENFLAAADLHPLSDRASTSISPIVQIKKTAALCNKNHQPI
jgi:hypothetical protein